MVGIEPIGLPDWHVTNPDHTPWEEDEDFEVEEEEEEEED